MAPLDDPYPQRFLKSTKTLIADNSGIQLLAKLIIKNMKGLMKTDEFQRTVSRNPSFRAPGCVLL